METARSSETSVSYHITTRRHNPEGYDLTEYSSYILDHAISSENVEYIDPT
jgi:hypothetical protein